MGRPAIYTDKTVVFVSAEKARTKLQAGSERRAIVNYLIDNGGRKTLEEIDAHFGYIIRPSVIALVRNNWLTLKETS